MSYTKEDFKPLAFFYHGVYGYGQILVVIGEKVTIRFDNGNVQTFTIENLIKSYRFRFL